MRADKPQQSNYIKNKLQFFKAYYIVTITVIYAY